ncbi:MAG TPA: hypothetical protein DCE41_16070 [Cytophagales bacterium]|nr:hypothetical protein [Cytophagales bacterium]HAA24030.1 hypothetical protein [Cytophagales bacterium]HAP64673.1 hypothetical protein [Cytophagales bacterium]
MPPKPLPKFFIGEENTQKMIERFKKEKAPVLAEHLGKPDSESVWFSRDHIADWLKEIDHAGGNGLRINFGVYGPEDATEAYPVEGQTCLVIHITRGQNGKEKDNVILEDEPDFQERSKIKRKGFNMGSLCPPRCEDY